MDKRQWRHKLIFSGGKGGEIIEGKQLAIGQGWTVRLKLMVIVEEELWLEAMVLYLPIKQVLMEGMVILGSFQSFLLPCKLLFEE